MSITTMDHYCWMVEANDGQMDGHGWMGEVKEGQCELHDDGENVIGLIPMYLPPASAADCASTLLYQLLSGEGSLCMAFFFMLSRYSCCDTAKTDANISSSSQSVRPIAKQEQNKPRLYNTILYIHYT